MDHLSNLYSHLVVLIEKRLWAKVLLSMLLGLLLGLVLRYSSAFFSKDSLILISSWLAFPGKLFIKLVQMVMVALVISSVISGIGGSTGSQLKSLGLKSMLYFIFTTIVAVALGILVSFIFFKNSAATFSSPSKNTLTEQNVFDLNHLPEKIINIIPENPLAAMLNGEMLSLVVFSIIIGIALLRVKEEYTRQFMKAINSIQAICMSVVEWSMKLVPYAVFGIMAGMIINTGLSSLHGLFIYFIAVLFGLFLVLLLYSLIVIIKGKLNPIKFLKASSDAALLAFSTASSAATMPLTLKIAEEKLQITKSVRNFIVPLGATINMDGTALYQCVSFLFIMHTYGVDLSVAQIFVSLITIVLASIGTPAVPGAGIIVLASVLKSSGIPSESIMVVIGMDRILGMFRSSVNVIGDLTACVAFNDNTK